MRRVAVAALGVVVLLAVAIGAGICTSSLLLSIQGYRTPLKGIPPTTDDRTQALTQQVVLVIIDGLRYDTSFRMPYLNGLRQRGAQAMLLGGPSSATQSTWVALITGASPELNDMPLFDRRYELIHHVTADNLFSVAERAGLAAGIAGYFWWDSLIPSSLLRVHYYVSSVGEQADLQVVDRAITFLSEFAPNLLVVQLGEVDVAGQQYGGLSAEYERAALQCDERIRLLATAMDLNNSVLVIASSYGHLGEGGHGGNEEVVVNTPLVMVGQNVNPGGYRSMPQANLAPTIAALLGTPVPAISQGRIQANMLRLDRANTAEKLLAVARQRVRVANLYLRSIAKSGLSQTAEGDVLVSASSLEVKNYESAAELAALAIEQTDRETNRARRLRQWTERGQRAVPFAAAVVIPLWLLWRARSRRTVWLATAALLAAVLYHALLVYSGELYTFSRTSLDQVVGRLAVPLEAALLSLAAGGAVVALRLWREQEQSPGSVLEAGLSYALLHAFAVGSAAAACVWWNGLRFAWYVPNLKVAFVELGLLIQAMLTAAASIAVPLLVLIVQRLLLVTSRWHRRRQPGNRGRT